MSKTNIPTVSEALLNREMGLSEVRVLLLKAIDSLKGSSHLKILSEKQLKEFWQKDYPPAPFEEVFTFKQIAEIDIDTFFKKRSVLPSKILGIVAAIEKAVSGSKAEKSTAISSNANTTSVSLNKKVRFYEIEYTSLISKCEKIIEILNLAADSPEFKAKNSKLLKSIDADLKKVNKLLSGNQEKFSKLI